MVFGKNRNQ